MPLLGFVPLPNLRGGDVLLGFPFKTGQPAKSIAYRLPAAVNLFAPAEIIVHRYTQIRVNSCRSPHGRVIVMTETISSYTDCRHKSSFIICVYLCASVDSIFKPRNTHQPRC
jgi:hypothetical protein